MFHKFWLNFISEVFIIPVSWFLNCDYILLPQVFIFIKSVNLSVSGLILEISEYFL
jgi:hypothetical protein